MLLQTIELVEEQFKQSKKIQSRETLPEKNV